jgi:hypothetical protein
MLNNLCIDCPPDFSSAEPKVSQSKNVEVEAVVCEGCIAVYSSKR